MGEGHGECCLRMLVISIHPRLTTQTYDISILRGDANCKPLQPLAPHAEMLGTMDGQGAIEQGYMRERRLVCADEICYETL